MDRHYLQPQGQQLGKQQSVSVIYVKTININDNGTHRLTVKYTDGSSITEVRQYGIITTAGNFLPIPKLIATYKAIEESTNNEVEAYLSTRTLCRLLLEN